MITTAIIILSASMLKGMLLAAMFAFALPQTVLTRGIEEFMACPGEAQLNALIAAGQESHAKCRASCREELHTLTLQVAQVSQ